MSQQSQQRRQEKLAKKKRLRGVRAYREAFDKGMGQRFGFSSYY